MLEHLVIHETIIKSNYVLCSYGLVCKTKALMAGSWRADSADIPALNDESTAGTTIWIQIQAALCVGERESVCVSTKN